MEQNPLVSFPGLYTLTVTNPTTGCTSTAQVEVEQDVTEPVATAGVGGLLTCTINSVTLEGSSSTVGVTYSWAGPGAFTSLEQNPVVSVPGLYTLTVTNPSTGCTSTAQVEVEQDITGPGATAGVSGLLTCTVSSVSLQGSSPTADVTYAWVGPGPFVSSEQNPVVSEPGLYTLTVTGTANGCTTTETIEVEEDRLEPVFSTNVSNVLTCTTTSATLSVLFDGAENYQVQWAGQLPGPNVTVSAAGIYTVTVTDLDNGCDATATVEVISEEEVPDLTIEDGQHTCITNAQGGLVLTPTSSVPNAQYSWTVPVTWESFFPDRNVQNLLIPFNLITGDFTVTVTNPASGCSNSETIEVTDNSTLPVCNISQGAGNTLSVLPTDNGTYEWEVNNPSWQIVNGQGSTSITFVPGPPGSTALFTITITNTVTGCTENCSLELRNTSGSAVPTTGALRGRSDEPLESKTPLSAANMFETFEPAMLTIYPNPVRDHATVAFNVPENSELRVELYSAHGDQSLTLYTGQAEAGRRYRVSLGTENLAKGLYLCRLVYGNKVLEKRIMLH